MMRLAFILVFALASLPSFAGSRTCIPPEEAAHHLRGDVCLRAHVYSLSPLPDGSTLLNLCSPAAPSCSFAILSPSADRPSVGNLGDLVDHDIEIRGVVRQFQTQYGMLFTHARQLRGGPEAFRPNPALAKSFSAEQHRPAFSDHAQRSAGSTVFRQKR